MTVKISTDSSIKKLQPMLAQAIANRLHPTRFPRSSIASVMAASRSCPNPAQISCIGSVFFQADDGALDARIPCHPEAIFSHASGSRHPGRGSLNKKTSFFIDFSDRHQDDQASIKATILSPNFLPEPLTENVPTPTSRISFSPRVDYQLNSKITLQARYTWYRSTSDNTGVGGFNLGDGGVNNENTAQPCVPW